MKMFVRKNSRIDVRLGGEIIGVTSVVDIVGVLVHPNVIYLHGCGESQMLEVDGPEVRRHSQVGDNIHGLLRDRARSDLNTAIGSHTSLLECPGSLAIGNPGDILRDT